MVGVWKRSPEERLTKLCGAWCSANIGVHRGVRG